TTHGRERRPPGGAGPRLADRHARRREVPGGGLPPLAARPPADPAAPARRRLRGHRGAGAADQLPATFSFGPALLPLPAAADAVGRPGVARAALRPGRQLQPLRRQGGAAAARRAPRLLLLHADALRLAHARRLLRRRGAVAQGPAARRIAGPAARLG